MSLRQELRHRRKNLPAAYRAMATEQIMRQVIYTPEFAKAQTIAGYIAFDGEVDPFNLLTISLSDRKQCFLPRIHQDSSLKEMEFIEIHDLKELSANHFGILEPIRPTALAIAPMALDVVLTPLVGFDTQAHRIGMGTGYYDKYFSFLKNKEPHKKYPFLIGLAFDCQYAEELPLHPDDIPLDMIITESRIIRR